MRLKKRLFAGMTLFAVVWAGAATSTSGEKESGVAAQRSPPTATPGERKPAYPVVGTIERSPFFQLFFLISPRSSSSEGAFSGGSASFVRGGGWGSEEFGPEAEALKADTNGAAGEMTVGPGGHALEGGGV